MEETPKIDDLPKTNAICPICENRGWKAKNLHVTGWDSRNGEEILFAICPGCHWEFVVKSDKIIHEKT